MPREIDLACAHLIMSGLGVFRPLYRVGRYRIGCDESAATVEARQFFVTTIVAIYHGKVIATVNLHRDGSWKSTNFDMADSGVATMLARGLRTRMLRGFCCCIYPIAIAATIVSAAILLSGVITRPG